MPEPDITLHVPLPLDFVRWWAEKSYGSHFAPDYWWRRTLIDVCREAEQSHRMRGTNG